MIEDRSHDGMPMNEQPPSSDVRDVVASRIRGREASNVRFSYIQVRRYDLVCTGLVNNGPAIGLGWSSTDDVPVSVEVYEQDRPTMRPSSKLVLSARQRTRILTEGHGFTIDDLHRIYNYRIGGGPQRKRSTVTQRIKQTTSISPALQQLAPAFGRSGMLRSATKMYARVGF